jgi:hypothetical protein
MPGELPKASIRSGADGPRALTENAAAGLGIEADEHAEEYRLGLIAGESADERQGLVG